jgi:hypothetical protein
MTLNIPPEIISLARQAAIVPSSMEKLLKRLSPENKAADQRGESFQAVLWLCQNQPQLVYFYWDYFLSMLTSDNTFAIFNAVYIIASIIHIDLERKFDGIYDRFLNLLNHRTVMVAGHTALNLSKIVKARTDLEPKITASLLCIDSNSCDPERLEILKGYILEALKEYYPLAQRPQEILIFVGEQLNCNNVKTHNLALEFLKMTGATPFNKE